MLSDKDLRGDPNFLNADMETELRYLRSYYHYARKFYKMTDEAVSEEEVRKAVGSLKFIPKPEVRRVLELAGLGLRFHLDEELRGEENLYYHAFHNITDWQPVESIPHAVNHTPARKHQLAEGMLVGAYDIWYHGRIPVEIDPREYGTAFLDFESCNLETTVWVNQRLACLRHYGMFPFRVDISEGLTDERSGFDSVVIRVRNTVSNVPSRFYKGYQPAWDTGLTSPWNGDWGGITGKASLVLTGKTFLKNIFFYTQKLNPQQATVVFRAEISHRTYQNFDAEVEVELRPWYPTEKPEEKTQVSFPLQAVMLNDHILEGQVELKKPEFWSPESPHLYLAHIRLKRDGEVIDDLCESFGVRTVEAKRGEILLNGERVFLRGAINMSVYPDSPSVCPSDAWIGRDILTMKHANGNCIRTHAVASNYSRTAEIADQLGMLLVWGGYFQHGSDLPDDLSDLARRDIPRVVRSLRNHPSIIIWEMGNEHWVENKRRYDYDRLAYELVYGEDPSRLIVPCSSLGNDLVWGMVGDEVIGSGNYEYSDFMLAKKQDTEFERLVKGHNRESALKADGLKTLYQNLELFRQPNLVLDFHQYGGWYRDWANLMELDFFKKAFQEIDPQVSRPHLITEFGGKGMPEWKRYRDQPWYGIWNQSNANCHTSRLGRSMTIEEWQESQAYLAIVVQKDIECMRAVEPRLAGALLCCLASYWSYHGGLVDFHRRPTLSYFVAREALNPVAIIGCPPPFRRKAGEVIPITIINDGSDTITDAELKVVMRCESGEEIAERREPIASVPTGIPTQVAQITLPKVKAGFYLMETVLQTEEKTLARSMDLLLLD